MEVSNLREPLNSSQEDSEGHEFDEQILYSSRVYCILTLKYLFIFYVCGVIISVPLLGGLHFPIVRYSSNLPVSKLADSHLCILQQTIRSSFPYKLPAADSLHI